MHQTATDFLLRPQHALAKQWSLRRQQVSLAHRCEAAHICRYGVAPAAHDVQIRSMEAARVLAVAASPSLTLAHNAIGISGVTLNTSKHPIKPRRKYICTCSGLLASKSRCWQPVRGIRGNESVQALPVNWSYVASTSTHRATDKT